MLHKTMFKHFGAVAGGLAIASLMGVAAHAQSLPPVGAKPGQCFAKVLIPAVYKTTPKTVVLTPESKKVTRVPAVYKESTKRVLVEEESYTLEVVPPVYKTVVERVMVAPERVSSIISPATYRTEAKKVLVSPARTEWKVGRGLHEKVNSATGEIMCLVEIPAVYKTVEHQVLDTPAQASQQVTPAEFINVERRIMETPPQTVRKVIPAKYETVTVKELVEPERVDEQVVAAKLTTIEQTELVSKENVEWREVLCETNTTPAVVTRIQEALVAKGFSIGTTPNGNYGPATRAAITKFQQKNGLETGGLTLNTLEKLGVSVSNI